MIPSLAAFPGCLFVVFNIIGENIIHHIMANNIPIMVLLSISFQLENPYPSLTFWKWIDRFSLSINTVSATSPSWFTILAR
jgi:hypothetical protein